jgi:hypothetical protein
MDKAELIEEVCQKIAKHDVGGAADIIQLRYKFDPPTQVEGNVSRARAMAIFK